MLLPPAPNCAFETCNLCSGVSLQATDTTTCGATGDFDDSIRDYGYGLVVGTMVMVIALGVCYRLDHRAKKE